MWSRIEPPVDFAIITALKIEREAIVRRLEGVERVQDYGEPLTYYVGSLRIPAEDQPYTVVLTQIIEMGNPDAAIATTKVIPRWRPRNVLMVGIAGGVKKKAALGDVVVSRYAHYYAPSKRKPKEVEHRDRQFSSDLMLFARAQHYDAAEWKGEIDSPRPGTGKAKLPEVRFGPIACGEEVIADDKALAELQRQCPKMVAVAMEGAGVAKAVLSAGDPPRYLEIRGVSDYAGPTKNDRWHGYAANAAAAFTIGFLRSRPFPPGPPPEQAAVKARGAPTLVVIAQSLRPISSDELMTVLAPDAKHSELEFLHLDFTDLVKNKVFTNPQAAAERVASPQGKLLAELARRGDARLVFSGLAAIPPVVLVGHVVTARRHVRLFDFHERDWAWPGTPQGFPKLQRSSLPKRPVKELGVAIIRMAVSYPVTKADTDPLGLDARLQIDLSLDTPARFVVKSEEQVLDYGRSFRTTLDGLRTAMPDCERVHLFYAGPMALAFHLGQQISENIHPPVTVWNYSRGYEWGLDLAAAVTGEPCVVYPALHGPIASERE
jgi:nucleoside phosphorylase